jgi:hypothetical protein
MTRTTETTNMKTLTAPQAALLARFDPKGFFIVEDFRNTNTPRTQVQDSAGRNHFTFGAGDSRAFKSLWRANVVVDLETTSRYSDGSQLNRTFFMSDAKS